MHTEHFDIGTIQAFLDGELAHERVSDVSAHIGNCDDCALMLAEAEDESAIVFPALEREFNTLVPTQRLWNKINDSIVIEKQNAPFWHKAWAFLSIATANPSITAAASILIVFALAATFYVNRSRTMIDTVAENTPLKVQQPAASTIPVPAVNNGQPGDTTVGSLRSIPQVERVSYTPEPRRAAAPTAVKASFGSSEPLPGEDSYIRTIDTLAKSVEGRKDGMMRPSERVAYERDMAVVDDSITKMRREVKKNPKNDSAKQVLYSSYQNKIDLLNSVAQKEELMSLK